MPWPSVASFKFSLLADGEAAWWRDTERTLIETRALDGSRAIYRVTKFDVPGKRAICELVYEEDPVRAT